MFKEGDRVEITELKEGDPDAEVGDRGTVEFTNHNQFTGTQVFVKLDKGISIGLMVSMGDSLKKIEEETK